MSGFSSTWLQLREPADHAARNAEITATLADFLAGRERIAIVDLGCGTGSTLRALAPVLPSPEQHWRLVDHDDDLLQAAKEQLSTWADAVEGESPLVLSKAGKRLVVVSECRDLSRLPVDFERTPVAGRISDWGHVDLITASALLDLVSPGWIRSLAEAAVLTRSAVLMALNYDGRTKWKPPHPFDDTMRKALNEHQRMDKGFGPALGSDAVECAASVFAAKGFRVKQRDSWWNLGAESLALQRELANGYAASALELGETDEAAVAQWLWFRRETRGETRIGHQDVLAMPIFPASGA